MGVHKLVLPEQVRNPYASAEPRLRSVSERDPGRRKRVATRISEIPSRQRACRAGRHIWPSDELETGRRVPKGLTAQPTQVQGVSRIEDECRRCGKVRWKLTLPDHIYDPGAIWSYINPKDWVTLSEDLYTSVTKGDIKAYEFAQHAAELFR